MSDSSYTCEKMSLEYLFVPKVRRCSKHFGVEGSDMIEDVEFTYPHKYIKNMFNELFSVLTEHLLNTNENSGHLKTQEKTPLTQNQIGWKKEKRETAKEQHPWQGAKGWGGIPSLRETPSLLGEVSWDKEGTSEDQRGTSSQSER